MFCVVANPKFIWIKCEHHIYKAISSWQFLLVYKMRLRQWWLGILRNHIQIHIICKHKNFNVSNWKTVANNSKSTIWLIWLYKALLQEIDKSIINLFFWVVNNMIKSWVRIKNLNRKLFLSGVGVIKVPYNQF